MQRFARAIVLTVFLSASLAAQTTVTVPAQNPVYLSLDRLIASGLVEVGMVGQRPFSRREIARIVASASAAAATHGAPEATQRLIARLEAEFAADLRPDGAVEKRQVQARWAAQLLGVDSPARTIPNDPVNKIDAAVNPILQGRAGRTFVNGANLEFEADIAARAHPNLAVQARPRLLLGAEHRTSSARGSIEALSATTMFRNIRVDVGRQQLVWGQGMEGGLLGSSSGRALDMVRFSTEAPFTLGSLFRYLGPMRGAVYIADLGGRQNHPHAAVIAYKLSGHPFVRRFELSGFVLGQQLGKGAPRATAWDHIADMIPVFKYTLPDNTAQFSNKFAGWDWRVRIPELWGMQLYVEHAFDDMDPRRWKSTLWEDGGHIAGVSVARLDAPGALSAAVEYHHTGLRYYEHAEYTSGLTFNGTLIGDPLGPKADGGYLRVVHDAGGSRTARVDFAVERRRGDLIDAISTQPDEADFHFVVVQYFPVEWRYRAALSWRVASSSRAVSVETAVERVRNFGFVDARDRTNLLLGVRLESR